ncbi:MAG: hypothetical protein GC156_06835 [Actinomycetales bacterium]|nr:hypothetical protein [Actinomycetales bacterium]
MLALLRTRRWLGFTIVVLLAIIGFGLLSRWQWARAEQHREERIALAAALAEAPTSPDRLPSSPAEWTPITVVGTYRADLQAAVRKRPLNAVNGFWVMTPLVTSDGMAYWINRGWLATTGDALSTPDLPAPPSGRVTVSGLVRAYEEADASRNDGLPAGQIAAPALPTLPSVAQPAPYFVQLRSSDPEQDGLTVLPLPEVEMDEGRNISYAVQWLLFALVAIGGWFFFLRREAREDAERAADQKELAWTSE